MIRTRADVTIRNWLILLTFLFVVVLCGCERQEDKTKSAPLNKQTQNEPKQAELSKYNIGIVTWVGYGPLFVAQKKGFFKEEGIDIAIKVMDGPGQRESAYLSGELDFFPNTPDAFAIFASQGAKGKMIMAMDESRGADGLVAKKEIADISGLKGKKVGFQSGITSHFFLLFLLNKAGLTGKDVVQENLGAGEAGAAFVAGKLDAAVTWEPWLTKARELPDAKVLATSKDTPGLLADILMVNENILAKHRKDVLAFMRAWFSTINYMRTHQEECVEIMSESFKLENSEVRDMLSTDYFYTLDESSRYFGTKDSKGKLYEVFEVASKLYQDNGVIDSIPQADPLIDTTLLEELKK